MGAKRIRRGRVATSLLVALVLLALGASDLRAHALAPSLLELRELPGQRAAVRWKQPAQQPPGTRLWPLLPESCIPEDEGEWLREGTGVVHAYTVACEGPLRGLEVGVDGLASSPTSVLLRVESLDGETLRQVLNAKRPSLKIPKRQTQREVAVGYAELGFDHILSGFDHLLFVLALIILVPTRRALLWTITAFTVGHSITLALAALGWIAVPQAPIEAVIAFSIFVLAVEIVRREEGRATLIERSPWLVAGSFGLLHGLGFAGALAEVGLPKSEIPLSLFSFNLGIEAGQLTFVTGILLGWGLFRKLPVAVPAGAAVVPAYAIGVLGAYWFFERSWQVVAAGFR